ncbi:MAG: glycosyltransferase [Candidatus Dadabacteria bacterium]|nr:MAG: glycosyltransferase [Candidatus Dadabacteria bacterium]
MTDSVSIIIPARNEQEYLPACLESVWQAARLAGIEPEVIVVINRSNDRTEEIAKQAGCRIVREDARNLARIRNVGLRAAEGNLLITVDADSIVAENMFTEILKIMNTDRYVGGGVLILPERWSLGILLSGVMLLPIVLCYRIAGGLFFFTREGFEATGGFSEDLVSAEDIDFARRLKAYGKSINKKYKILLRSYIITSCRKFDRLGDWYFIKNIGTTIKLLRGREQELANKIWYDFKR